MFDVRRVRRGVLAALLLCTATADPALGQRATRSPEAPPRVYGLELDTTRGGRERLLIFAEEELERRVEAPQAGILRLLLDRSVLADSAPRSLMPAVDGAVRSIRVEEVATEGRQVVQIDIEHVPGLQARVSNQGAIIAVEFPQFARPDDRGFALHFDNEPLAEVVQVLGGATGERYIYDDRLRGTVTIMAPDRVSRDEALALLDAALYMRGFAAVRGPEDFRKIVPIDQVAASAPFAEGEPGSDSETPVTVLLRLDRAEVDPVLQALAPMLGNTGLAVPLYESNSVILAGNEAQLHRFMVVAQALDRADVDEVRILRLAERSVAEVVPILAELTRDSQHSTGASGVSIWADERSNALIVRASPARFEDIRHWVEALDTEREGWGEVQVIRLHNADPEEIAEHLQALAGGRGEPGGELEGLVVAAHPPTSSLVVRASPQGHATVRRVVGELDLRPPQVAIEVGVVEIRVGEDRNLGLNYLIGIGDPEANPGDVFGVISRVPEGGFPDIVETPVIQDQAFAARVRGKDIAIPVLGPGGPTVLTPLYQVLVTADAGEVESRILMRPRFIATNGEEQEFFVGDTVPIEQAASDDQSGDSFNLSIDVERRDVGIELRVKPSIGQAGGVTLDLSLDFTAVAGIGDESFEVVLLQRRLDASAHLRDGEFAVIGFSSRERDVEVVSRSVPFFRNIPGMNWLFGSESVERVQSYFLVTAQATIQRTPEEVVAWSMRTRLAMQRSLARVGDLRTGEGVRYAVLIATRGEPAQATAIAESLPLRVGEEAQVSGWTWGDRPRFDVLVTGFRDISSAGQAATRLRETGYHPQVIAVPAPEQDEREDEAAESADRDEPGGDAEGRS